MTRLALVLPTLGNGKWQENHASWGGYAANTLVVRDVCPLTAAYQRGYKWYNSYELVIDSVRLPRGTRQLALPDILGFVHDDVTCLDSDWHAKVMREFDDPTVGLVGLGGSEGHGVPWIYQRPYEWEQVGRTGRFMSAMVNAEQHGMRITQPMEASVLDGFAMFVRRQVLDNSPYGGWPQATPIAYWCYDYWLSCETRRQGFRVRVVPVTCEHTCPPEFRPYVVNEDCQAAHQWLYENYRDTFPAHVENPA